MTLENSAKPGSTSNRTVRKNSYRIPAFLFVMVAGLGMPACVAQSGDVDSSSDSADQGYDAIEASDAISRAEEWVNAKLHYCQSANHQRDFDASCSSTCERTDNSQWDPYRSDCSGLVSWAWGLAAPGRVTGEFAPFENDITHAISASELQTGDAVNNSEHVMLFKNWVTHGSVATFIEEPGCSSATPYAHEFTSNVSISGQTIHVSWNGMTFTAIRYDGIGSGGGAEGPPTCSVAGVEGQCIETSACAAKAGHHSTAGVCPGPANEECCTPEAAPPPSAPACKVDGVEGTCIQESACASKGGHHTTPGFCPGPDSEECCTPNAEAPPPPPPPPSGPSCTVEGNEGVCIAKSTCSGMAGHVSTPGFCPGPASEECCTKPQSCSANGKEGMCVETSVCAGLGRQSVSGHCPGPANEECCIQ